jgi:GntR family transcriptional regulator/MocR family aminotransferase
MSAGRRLALLRFAKSSNSIVFEDDYDGEFRHSGQPLPSLQGLDKHGRVIYAGNFSKTMFPGLRLSYVVLPEAMVDVFADAISLTARFTPIHAQAALAAFMEEGHFGRHVRSMRQLYAERQDTLIQAAQKRLSKILCMERCEVGLQTIGWMNFGLDDVSASSLLGNHGIEVTPLSPLSINNNRRAGLLFGFAAVDSVEIRRAIEKAGRLLEQHFEVLSVARR